jgi:hypothetical protein
MRHVLLITKVATHNLTLLALKLKTWLAAFAGLAVHEFFLHAHDLRMV